MAGLIGQAGELAINANTALPLALSVTLSDAADFFESGAFTNFRKGLEAKQRMNSAVLQHIGAVVKSIGELGKVLSRRR